METYGFFSWFGSVAVLCWSSFILFIFNIQFNYIQQYFATSYNEDLQKIQRKTRILWKLVIYFRQGKDQKYQSVLCICRN